MRELPALQQQLNVAHQLTHLRRRDRLSQPAATLAAVFLTHAIPDNFITHS